jgi:hypothetical protein
MFVESEGGVGFERGGRRRKEKEEEERRSVSIVKRRDLEVVSIRLCRFWRP